MVWEYGDGQTLEDCLYAAIHVYDDSRSNHFAAFSQNSQEIVDLFDALGKHVIEGIKDLRAPEELAEVYRRGNSVPRILAEFKNDALRRVVLERLEIESAFRYSTPVSDMATRAFELSEYLLSEPLPEIALRYLRRITRCYVVGFDSECIILSRGVLESALRDRYVRSHTAMPDKQRDRFDKAYQLGWLTPAGKRAAQDIWTRGNKAIHDDPDVTKDILGTIRMTALVLGDLATGQ